MRSFLLMLLTVVVLFGAFVLYTKVAAPPARLVTGEAGSATQESPPGPDEAAAFASGAWVNLYDKSGQFYGRLRSATCSPRPDGLYHLVNPQAEFFEHDGTIFQLTAVQGDVRLGQQNHRTSLMGGPFDPPSQGTVYDVTMRYFLSQSERDKDRADLVLTLPNAAFDADTYKLFTTDQTDEKTGQVTLGEQAQVTLRGTDMDFDGKGLRLDWNGELHDLTSLLIVHGQHMKIKNVADANPKAASTGGPNASGGVAADVKPRGQMAQTEQVAAGPSATVPTAPATQPAGPRAYMATLTSNVHVMQGGKALVDADEMEVVTVRKPGGQSAGVVTAPVEAPAPQQAVARADKPVQIAPAPAQIAPSSAPAVAGAKENQPVDIDWTGPMKIVPAVAMAGMNPGEAVVHFKGSPVHIYQDSAEMTADQAQYNSSNKISRLNSDAGHMVQMTMKQADGTASGHILAPRVKYQADQRLAEFLGAGSANFANPQPQGKEDDAINAGWTNELAVHLAGDGQQQHIDGAKFLGNSWLSDGPRGEPEKMRLSGQSILATFYPLPAPVAGRGAGAGGAKQSETAQVKSIVATGPAHCVIRDEKEPEKQIDADTLTITTLLDSAGKPYPDSINATGHAHAVEMSADGMAAAQDIFSKQMDITLSPPPAKASLQKFLATGDVTATRVNGDRIKGDGLSEEIVDGEQVIHLWGSPPAQVIGSNGTLSGRELELKPKEQWAKVTGPGTIDCSKESDPKKPAQPMHVAWSQGAELKGDLINVNGDVSAETTDPTTGQASRATGDHAVLELVEVAAPATTPATTPATVPAAAKAAADGDVDMLGNKQVKTVTLTDNATMTSTRLGADGLIVQRAFIEGSTIYTEVKEQRLKVPGKGRMLLEDHAPVAAGATTGPSHQPTTGGTHQPTTDQSVMGGHGATAFSWANGFLFDQGTRHCDITGAVVIRHLSDANKADWTTVTADKVTADFEPVDGAATKPAEGLDQSQMKLKRLGATGSVVIQTGGATVNASVVDYDPATELMTAIGSVDDPVTVTSQQGRRDGSFQQAVIDTRTNKIVRMLDFTGKSR